MKDEMPDINEIPESRDRIAEIQAYCDFKTLLALVDGRTRSILLRLRDGHSEEEIAAELGLAPLEISELILPSLRARFGRQFGTRR